MKEILGVLERIKVKAPGLRVCQTISNAIPEEVKIRLNHDLYYIEDSLLLEYLLQFEKVIDNCKL
jgi:hypothetical protein